MADFDPREPRSLDPGKTPGKSEGERDVDNRVTESGRPGKTPGKSEGDRETERVNLGE
jgi:hypothetical protein